MAKSLQEQLLEAGALDKGRAQKLKKQKHKQAKQKARGAESPDQVKQAAAAAAAEKAARDRELSRQRQAALEQRAIAAQVRQLIERNLIAHGNGDIAYSFSDDSLVKTIYVEPEQQVQLGAGRLAIVRFDGGYALVVAPVAAKIAERDPASVVVLNIADDEESDIDDEYADYQIPDDLTW